MRYPIGTVRHRPSHAQPERRRTVGAAGRSGDAVNYRPIVTPDSSRGELQTLDVISHWHRAANHGLRIERQDEILDNEVERLAVNLDAGDRCPLHVHRHFSVSSANVRGGAHGTFAVQQLRHQPSRLVPLGAAQLAEIDQGRTGNPLLTMQDQPGVTNSGGRLLGGKSVSSPRLSSTRAPGCKRPLSMRSIFWRAEV